jgi:predicted transcriptional regulator
MKPRLKMKVKHDRLNVLIWSHVVIIIYRILRLSFNQYYFKYIFSMMTNENQFNFYMYNILVNLLDYNYINFMACGLFFGV